MTKSLEKHKQAFLDNPDIKPEDKKLVEKFIAEYGTTRNHSARTNYKYYSYFKTVLIFLDVPIERITFPEYLRFRQALQQDTLNKVGSKYAVKFNGEAYSESSKEDFDALFRRVIRWHRKYADPVTKEEITKILEESPYKPNKNKIEEPDILKEDEILKVIKKTTSIRDKAMISVLWETGARTSEILTLKIGDIKPLQYNSEDKGLLMSMRQSKTTKRTLPLIESAPYLQAYINQHPDNSNSRAPLWFLNKGKPMTYSAMRKTIQARCRKAGINKRIYNHLFRHSRATHLADKGWSESQLCAWFGWKIGSEMPATYIRRSGINLTNAVLEMHGFKSRDEEGETGKLLPRPCFFCEHPNPRTYEYCENCQKPLDPTKIAEQEKASADMISSMVEMKVSKLFDKYRSQLLERYQIVKE